MNIAIILSCEHASAEIPDEFQELFFTHSHASSLLNTHRALDIGALSLWNSFKEQGTNLVSLAIKGEYTRLLIDLNRSEKHPSLFSTITQSLDKSTKKNILETYYQPYRQTILEQIQKLSPPILHLSVHTFTPILNNIQRQTDIGLLYDPQRPFEKEFCRIWAKSIRINSSDYRIRMNYPYYGKSDGLTSFLRKQYTFEKYWGIELEVNQKFFLNNTQPHMLLKTLAHTFFCAAQEMSLTFSEN